MIIKNTGLFSSRNQYELRLSPRRRVKRFISCVRECREGVGVITHRLNVHGYSIFVMVGGRVGGRITESDRQARSRHPEQATHLHKSVL